MSKTVARSILFSILIGAIVALISWLIVLGVIVQFLEIVGFAVGVLVLIGCINYLFEKAFPWL